jgi:hypothetical protein
VSEEVAKKLEKEEDIGIGPDGEKNIAPKDDGSGVMISAFQSREFGFRVVMSEEQL